ncbi:ADP-ribose pyrophosphatase [Tenacibaculum litopenaei]|uniref:(deoxy)nucleoside triphosphate pyrophosphohydrolase n=1 Tax=Tenacibaculum litopenaei TaxID=396016 RepID=UPI003894CF5D
MINVVCGIIYKNDKIFIARKKTGTNLAGYWEFPGGKIEKGENPKTALKRELLEELDMQVTINEQIGINIHKYETITINLIAYHCNFIKATYHLTDHDHYEWVHPKELLNYKFAPADIPFLSLI